MIALFGGQIPRSTGDRKVGPLLYKWAAALSTQEWGYLKQQLKDWYGQWDGYQWDLSPMIGLKRHRGDGDRRMDAFERVGSWEEVKQIKMIIFQDFTILQTIKEKWENVDQ